MEIHENAFYFYLFVRVLITILSHRPTRPLPMSQLQTQ